MEDRSLYQEIEAEEYFDSESWEDWEADEEFYEDGEDFSDDPYEEEDSFSIWDDPNFADEWEEFYVPDDEVND